MKIMPIANGYHNSIKNNAKHNKDVSFKNIYIEDITDIGHAKRGSFPPRFSIKDALLMNELAMEYPNQDCFIKRGEGQFPRLEFREKPIDVTVFTDSLTGFYNIGIDPKDPEYEAVEMILYSQGEDNSYKIPKLNLEIGVPSYISTNPSLQYTIKMGFECHKKVMEKKYQILEVLGKNEEVSLGDDSLITKAHNATEDVEVSVIRYLMESAFLALTEKASAKKLYESNYLKIQSVLDDKRKFDLVTCTEKQPKVGREGNGKDICDELSAIYPNTEYNIKRINELIEYMLDKGITLYDSEDLLYGL